MALTAFVETLEGIPEHLHEEYGQVEGGYKLNVVGAGGYELENIAGLKNALSSERKLTGDLQKKVTKFEKEYKDIDISQYAEMKSKYDEFMAFDPETEADKLAKSKYDTKLKNQQKEWQTKFDEEVNGRETRISNLTGQLQNLMIHSTAVKALAENGAGDSVELLLPHVLKSTKLVEKDGSLTVEIVNSDGTPRVRSDGKNMTIDDLIPEFKQKWPSAFSADVKGGSGAPSSTKPAAPAKGDLSANDMILAGLQAMASK